MLAIPVINWLKNLVGMLKVRLGVASCMTSLLCWRETKFTKSHAWIHPRIAVRNARKITDLNAKEEDIIIKHMWGATLAPPRYKESFVVTMVDKYWAVKEASEPWRKKMAKRRFFHRKMLKS